MSKIGCGLSIIPALVVSAALLIDGLDIQQKPAIAVPEPVEEIVSQELYFVDEIVLEEKEEPLQIVELEPEPEAAYIFDVSDEEIELMARITFAEAEAEPEYGQRLVIDTMLNRRDGSKWPNDIYSVLTQPNQYSYGNDRFNRSYATEELINLVKEELQNRTDPNVVFFRTTRYSDYGTPYTQVCCHYFSA